MNIVYKYKVGDKIKFRTRFTNPTCGLAWRAGTVVTITGIAPSYNNKPHYYVNDVEDEVFPESVFAGPAVASVDAPLGSFDFRADTSKPSLLSCDTGDSGESKPEPPHDEAEWSWVTEDDLYCSSCGYAALNDYRGNPAASKFCPHCGRYMTNHQQPED